MVDSIMSRSHDMGFAQEYNDAVLTLIILSLNPFVEPSFRCRHLLIAYKCHSVLKGNQTFVFCILDEDHKDTVPVSSPRRKHVLTLKHASSSEIHIKN